MKITSMRAAVAAGLLVTGMTVGAGATYAVQTLSSSFAGRTGLFTLQDGEWVNYSATLDDHRGASPATVSMRIIDKRGATVAQQNVVLQAGQSATLPFRGVGSFRALSEVVQPDTFFGDRRRVLTTLEIFFGKQDPDGGFSIPRTYVCAADSDGGGNGRLPD